MNPDLKKVYDSLSIEEVRKSYPNVVAVGIGTKHEGGADTGQECLVFYVARKLPLSDLEAQGLPALPREFQGVPVDVEEGGEIKAGLHGPRLARHDVPDLRALGFGIRKRLARLKGYEVSVDDLLDLLDELCGKQEPPLTGKWRPVQPGVSCGHPNVTAGTLGAIVMFRDEPAGLSCSHVIADTNRAELGDPVLQPGVHDGGTDAIGELVAFDPIDFAGVNTIEDAAVAGLDEAYRAEYPRGGGRLTGVVPESEINAHQGSRNKVGRTTGLSKGSLRSFPTKARVGYGGGRVAQFSDLAAYSDMSDPGDSGSVIRHDNGRGESLLFAGSEAVTLGQVLERVFARFELSVA